jgi:hypothetical protein
MADAPARHYTLGKMKLAPEPDTEGRMVEMWTIPYRTPSGAEGYVKIPDELLSAENIDRQVQYKVEQLEAAAALGSQQ